MSGNPNDIVTGQEYLDTIVDPLVAAGLYANRGEVFSVFGADAIGRTRRKIAEDAIAKIRENNGL